MLARFRAYFLAGVLISAPIYVTASIAVWIVDFIDETILPLIPIAYNPDIWLQQKLSLPFSIPGFGVIILIIALTILGAITAGFAGRALVRIGERILNHMPIIRTVYGGSKQILETVLQNQSEAFNQAVLIEYPRKDLWAIGFITSDTKGEILNILRGKNNNQKMVNVFLPTTPNPTSGFLLFVPLKDISILDMKVEDAIKLIISAGIVSPDMINSAISEKPASPSIKQIKK